MWAANASVSNLSGHINDENEEKMAAANLWFTTAGEA
jgi:hypothetical protein